MTAEHATAARPMRADARRNYDRLVAAARDLLGGRAGEVSMEEIAKAADVGVGTLYRHFPRRIDLVEAVYRDDVAGLVAAAERNDPAVPPWQGLVDWLYGFVRYAHAKRNFLTELHEAFEKNPDLASMSRDRVRAAAGMVLARAQAAGVARTDIDGPDLMQLVGGMCMSRGATVEQTERLLKLVLDGVHTP